MGSSKRARARGPRHRPLRAFGAGGTLGEPLGAKTAPVTSSFSLAAMAASRPRRSKKRPYLQGFYGGRNLPLRKPSQLPGRISHRRLNTPQNVEMQARGFKASMRTNDGRALAVLFNCKDPTLCRLRLVV